MTIGIVLNPYGETKPGGLARVIFEWTNALIARDRENTYKVFVKGNPKVPDFTGAPWSFVPLGNGAFWLDRLAEHACDVYLFNTPVLPLSFRPKRSVILAYDFPYKHLPATTLKEYIQYKLTGLYHGWSLRRANAVISVSESTKDEIVQLFGVTPQKITPIYHGFKRICALPETTVALPEKFFFFAGTIKERKNVLNIVKAYELFRKEQGTHKLVIGGKKEGPYYERIVRYITAHALTGDVVFLDHLNDQQLSYTYRRAEALIFPSLIEGTGNPILEAMDCGIPVITSNIFGPAELGSNGSALLIDPYKPEEIADAMRHIVCDPELRKTLVQKGFEQVKYFSWDTAFKETMALFRSL